MSKELLRLAGATLPPGANVSLKLSSKEVARYSVGAALAACQEKNASASYERELTVECWKRMKRAGDPAPYELIVPYEVLWQQRDVSVAASGGGYLVESKVPMLADFPRPRGIARRVGTTFLTGVASNVSVARQSATATTKWLSSELDYAAESQQTVQTIPLAPRTVSAYEERSPLLALQAPDLSELLIRRDLAALAEGALDVAMINGTGTADPQGIITTQGVGTFNGGSVTWANVLEAQTDVLNANARASPASFAYVTTPAVANVLATRQGFSTNAPMWLGGLDEGTLAGARAFSSTNVPAATIVAGDWSQLLVAEFGPGVEIRVNPYAQFKAGIIGYSLFYTVDTAVIWPSAFSVATSVS